MQTLVKTLNGENGEVFAIIDGRRILLIKCRPKIDIYEHSQNINTLGAQGYRVKTLHAAIIFCLDRETTRDVDVEFLRTVSRFEFSGDFQREDGIFERVRFDNLNPIDGFDLLGDWVFEVIGQNEIIKKLITL